MAASAPVAEQRNPEQNDMLRLNDELDGLIEAAEMSADPHGVHIRKPEAASSVPGEAFGVEGKWAAACLLVSLWPCSVLRCAVNCSAVKSQCTAVRMGMSHLVFCCFFCCHPLTSLGVTSHAHPKCH